MLFRSIGAMNERLGKYMENVDSQIMHRRWQASHAEERLRTGTASQRAKKEKNKAAYAAWMAEGMDPLEPVKPGLAFLRRDLLTMRDDAIQYMIDEGAFTDEQLSIMEGELGISRAGGEAQAEDPMVQQMEDLAARIEQGDKDAYREYIEMMMLRDQGALGAP